MMRLTIGEVGKRVGLTGKAIRLYEARGLVPAPERTDSGYRSYTDHHVALLRFIPQARALGLSLEEIREVLDLRRTGAQPCATVLQLLTARIREIDTTMSNLRALRKALVRARDAALASRDHGHEAVVCQIIEAQPTG